MDLSDYDSPESNPFLLDNQVKSRALVDLSAINSHWSLLTKYEKIINHVIQFNEKNDRKNISDCEEFGSDGDD